MKLSGSEDSTPAEHVSNTCVTLGGASFGVSNGCSPWVPSLATAVSSLCGTALFSSAADVLAEHVSAGACVAPGDASPGAPDRYPPNVGAIACHARQLALRRDAVQLGLPTCSWSTSLLAHALLSGGPSLLSATGGCSPAALDFVLELELKCATAHG